MRSSHSLDRLDVAFDDDRLVADAGLLLPATLAVRLGFARQAEAEFAGVLVFRNFGLFGTQDPALYLHPRWDAPLPSEFEALSRRTLHSDGVRVETVPEVYLMAGLWFSDPHE